MIKPNLDVGPLMAGAKPSRNIYLMLALVLFIGTLGSVIYIVQYKTNAIVAELTLNRVQAANRSLVNYLSELKDRVIMRVGMISANETVINSIQSGDYATLGKFLRNFALGMSFASVCDTKGIVLARTQSALTGDDVSGYQGVSAALRAGVTTTAIERIHSNDDRLALYASAPIYDSGGIIIGVVNCNYDLTQTEHLDVFKERTGSEATIILGDTRINSTIADASGKRIIGSKVPAFIVEAVVRQEKDYLGYLNIAGAMYGSCYSPLASGGEIIGMLFTGVDIRSTLASRRAMNYWIIVASLIGIAATVAFMLIANITARKYARLVEKQLQQQILMADISRNFLTDTNADTLITDTLHRVGEFMRISQVLLFWLEGDGCTLICRNEWINQKFTLPPNRGWRIVLKEPMLSKVKNLNPVSGKDACWSSDDADFTKVMAPYRLHFNKYIIAPIFLKGRMAGIIDFAAEDDGKTWSDSDINLANLVASTLSGVFEREAMGRRTSIVENSPHIIFYADRDGNLAYANPAATAVTGYTTAEIKAGGLALLFDEQTVRDIREIFIPKTLLHGKDRHQVLLMCKDGRRRVLEMTSFIAKDEILAAIAIDLTEIRELESELHKAKERAERTSRAKSEFLSRMSHEMRTPMNAIIGLTEIAKKSDDIDKIKSCLEKTGSSSTHLLSIINDILDMTSIETDSLEMVYGVCNLEKLLLDAVNAMHFRTYEKKQNLDVHLDDKLPQYIICNGLRLSQVIMHLLANAVKFTPEGGNITLAVNVADISGDLYTILTEVTDNGIGIDMDDHSRLFEPFEQADGGGARKYGGAGLGLSLSKRIVEQMDGKIWVESELGHGSKFSFTVTVQKGKAQSAGEGSETAIIQPREAREGDDDPHVPERVPETRNLLIVEDVELNRMIVEEMLASAGFVMEFAENGRQAIDMYKASPGKYSLILMDINMPEVDGYTATQSIRALDIPGSADIPIIAMTANVFQQDIDKCLAAGMDDHIGKPLDVGVLLNKIYKYIKLL